MKREKDYQAGRQAVRDINEKYRLQIFDADGDKEKIKSILQAVKKENYGIYEQILKDLTDE